MNNKHIAGFVYGVFGASVLALVCVFVTLLAGCLPQQADEPSKAKYVTEQQAVVANLELQQRDTVLRGQILELQDEIDVLRIQIEGLQEREAARYATK